MKWYHRAIAYCKSGVPIESLVLNLKRVINQAQKEQLAQLEITFAGESYLLMRTDDFDKWFGD